MLLADIKKGEHVVITNVKPCEIQVKLMEMGCVPGTHVYLSMKAPLGDPLAFNVDGYFLSMRKAEAAQIEVEYLESKEK